MSWALATSCGRSDGSIRSVCSKSDRARASWPICRNAQRAGKFLDRGLRLARQVGGVRAVVERHEIVRIEPQRRVEIADRERQLRAGRAVHGPRRHQFEMRVAAPHIGDLVVRIGADRGVGVQHDLHRLGAVGGGGAWVRHRGTGGHRQEKSENPVLSHDREIPRFVVSGSRSSRPSPASAKFAIVGMRRLTPRGTSPTPQPTSR
jgi:hypothetical protein